jgi:hypothetical protein
VPRYRITIAGFNREAMLDLVRKHKIKVSDHGIHQNKERGYVVEAIAEPAEIEKLEALGYQVQTHEDVDARGRERQSEVGRGDRYTRPKPE